MQKYDKEKTNTIVQLQNTIQRMKETPLGARECKQIFSSIETLAPDGGARKRRVLATRWACTSHLINYNIYSFVGTNKLLMLS